MSRLDAIIFDFDGTLADVPLDFDLMKNKIAALGECFMDERPVPTTKPALEWLEELAGIVMERDRDEGLEFLSRGRLVITATELDAARDGCLFHFTKPILTELDERGVAAGVITRNITAAVKVVFPDIEQFAKVFVPREDACKVKPDPAHLLQALEVLGVAPSRALMVGDHPMDILTAKRAGAVSAAVTTGNIDADGFADLSPDFLCTDAGSLMDELKATGWL